jgi:hypothetical protein
LFIFNFKNGIKVGESRIEKWIRYPQFVTLNRGEILCWCGFGVLKYRVDKFLCPISCAVGATNGMAIFLINVPKDMNIEARRN